MADFLFGGDDKKNGMVKKLKVREIPFLFLVVVVFVVVAGKYHKSWLTEGYRSIQERWLATQPEVAVKRISTCSGTEILIKTDNGNLCREVASPSAWLDIFDQYPAIADGREIIYEFLDEGDLEMADLMLAGKMPIERYETITLSDPITWEEDPFGERYWRYVFYSLRETRHLLWGYKQTGQEGYKDKLVQIVQSFLEVGMDKPHAWDDYHGVAYRTMTLVNTWWKLREENALSVQLSEKILKAIVRHAEFLLQEEHYEPDYNHGITEAAALYLAGKSFPDLAGSRVWSETGWRRINSGISTIVDEDGSLVENSPFYHFYALEKYWSLNKYFEKIGEAKDKRFSDKLEKMISFSTYILMPNLKVPLLGASIDRQIGFDGVFKEMADRYPEFKYVLTQGKEGKRPEFTSRYFPTTGQVIMRSDWEKKTKFENKFADQTQIIFDVGPYRTNHSDLDALGFNLYSNGKTLITDTGLYTYEQDDDLKRYFHGTAGHNTIMVDGKDQRLGSPIPGKFVQGKNFTMHSAQHNLYQDTIVQRSMALIGHDLVLIVDRITSDADHNYEQLFHLFPNAKTRKDGNRITVEEALGKKDFVIRSLVDEAAIEIKEGKCSLEYEKAVSCPTIVYKQQAKDAVFVTLIEIGGRNDFKSAEWVNENQILLKTKTGVYGININQIEVNFVENSKSLEKEMANYDLELVYGEEGWGLKGENAEKFKLLEQSGKLTIVPKQPDENPIYSKRPFFKAQIDGVKEYYSIDQKLVLDIPSDPIRRSFRVYEQEDLLPILGYHQIIDDAQTIRFPSLEMGVSEFEKQVEYLTQVSGCRWFTLGQLVEEYIYKDKKLPERACVINFDDGRKNHFTNAYPVLQKYGAVGTFYVLAGRSLGNFETYLNLRELDQLVKSGNEIGSHSFDASSLLNSGYDNQALIYQIKNSKQVLSEQGYKVTTFAYPRGDQNQTITNLVSQHYLAGRDTAKDNNWRDVRTLTTGFGRDFMMHMHYFKPEGLEPVDLAEKIGYNSWWQFEEGYRVDEDLDGDVRILSSYDPTSNSYAIVDLYDIGDQISNKFLVSADGFYNLEIYGAGEMGVDVDGIPQRVEKLDNVSDCRDYRGQSYCLNSVGVYLKQGSHIISVKADSVGVKVDKFRIFRYIKTLKSYRIKLGEYMRTEVRDFPEQMEIELTYKNWLANWLTEVL